MTLFKNKLISLILVVAFALTMFPTSAFALSGYCVSCGQYSSFTVDYEEWTSSVHCVRNWCGNCGYDQNEGGYAESHSMNNGVCRLCGYNDGTGGGGGDSGGSGDTTCYHTSTYTEWSGCDWTEYCSNCGEYMNSGTSHGSTYTQWSGCDWTDYCNDCGTYMGSGTSHSSYSYGSWEYYNSSQHRRLYACSTCGEGFYDYAYHTITTKYSQYSSSQHQKVNYCATCDSNVSSTSYEGHSFTTGSWGSYDSSQHRRSKMCTSCGYITYEYASHSLNYGGWSSSSSSQHRRAVSCSCGYSTYEYANHSLQYGSWKNYSDSQHRRTVSCSCGYSSYEYKSHSMTAGKWSSISSSQHQRTNTCTCGYTKTETESHSMKPGKWSVYSEEQHKRVNTCDCGYSADEYGSHVDSNADDYCDSCGYLMTRFSVIIPTLLNLTMSKTGKVHAATTASIVNDSTAAVKVTSVTLNAQNDWRLVPYSTNMANVKVNSKQIGFYLNGVGSDGTTRLPIYGGWQIAKDGALALDYDAVISATSKPINEQVLTIVFVVDWAA